MKRRSFAISFGFFVFALASYSAPARACVSFENATFSAQFVSTRLQETLGEPPSVLEILKDPPPVFLPHCVKFENARVEGDLEVQHRIAQFEAVNTVFNGSINFVARQGKLSFNRSKFVGAFELYLAEVEKLDFNSCVFEESANFHSVKSPKFWLNGSTFKGHAVFVAIKIEDLNLADVKFEKSVDFAGAVIGKLNVTRIRTNQPIDIRWAQFGNTWLNDGLFWALSPDDETDRRSRLEQIDLRLRFWQRNFLALGYKSDALEASHEIINLRRKFFLSPWRAEWWASILLDFPSRYGTRPFRPLWVSLGVVLLFALVYLVSDPFVQDEGKVKYPKTPLPLFSLLYSLDIFVPFVAISGVTEWGWRVRDRFRWIVLGERLLGLSLTALAAYSVGSYLF